MAFPPSPEDRPDPNENMPAVRARVPENVARGEISTGVIVVTGGTEYVLDFVRNLPRPNTIVARVVLPHMVMPQFIEALSTNIDLYRQRYGELPGAPTAIPPIESQIVQASSGPTPSATPASDPSSSPNFSHDAMLGSPPPESTSPQPPAQQPESASSSGPGTAGLAPQGSSPTPPANAASQNPANANRDSGVAKRQNPQDIYDDLKIRDEILSGAYANAVMIGHGPYEFSFDFITNFYPQSAVSCRVYLAAGHIWRLLDSLRQSWDQLRPRLGMQPPPGNGPNRS